MVIAGVQIFALYTATLLSVSGVTECFSVKILNEIDYIFSR